MGNSRCPYLELPPGHIKALWKSQAPPGISISRTGRGFKLRWRDHYEDGSSKQNGPVVGSWEEALQVAKLVVRKKAAGEIYRPGKVKSVPTIAEVKESYLTGLQGARAPGTIKLKEIAIRHFIESIGGSKMLITDLRTRNMDDFRRWLIARGNKNSSINQRLNHCYLWWDEVFRLYVSEFPRLAPPIRRSVQEGVDTQASRPVLSWPAVDQLLPYLRNELPILCADGRSFIRPAGVLRKLAHKCFLVGRGTALRIRQVCELQWQDIDFHNELIHVHRGCKSKSEKRGRFIPLPEWLATELQSWERLTPWVVSVRHHSNTRYFGQSERNPASKGDIHWCGENEHRRRAMSDEMKKGWDRIAIPSEYTEQRCFHLMRHTFGTHFARQLRGTLLESLSSKDVVEYQLGHTPGLHGTYVSMWESYEHDLRRAALGFPAPESTQAEEGGIVDLRTWRPTGS